MFLDGRSEIVVVEAVAITTEVVVADDLLNEHDMR